MDRGAWWATVHWVAKSQTQLTKNTHNMKNIFIEPETKIIQEA